MDTYHTYLYFLSCVFVRVYRKNTGLYPLPVELSVFLSYI